MKTAIYIEDGITQLVLTPEDDFEKGCLSKLHQAVVQIPDPLNLQVKTLKFSAYSGEFYAQRGQFYGCQGGWIKQGSGDESLILRVDVVTPQTPPSSP